jgi:uncharacterized membrane-anchored protein YitT (DUF2179 family)
LLTDWMPQSIAALLQPHDQVINAVFGGLVNAFAISLCLFTDATTGGTDFIAIYFAEKNGRDAWNYILAGNVVILIFAACLFTPDKALYSIIFQFTTTMALNSLYRGYQRRTLLIITDKSEDIYVLIRDKTHHDATSFSGVGRYQKQERILLYSVVAATEVPLLVTEIKKIDPCAFINILRTESLTGKFFRKPKD